MRTIRAAAAAMAVILAAAVAPAAAAAPKPPVRGETQNGAWLGPGPCGDLEYEFESSGQSRYSSATGPRTADFELLMYGHEDDPGDVVYLTANSETTARAHARKKALRKLVVRGHAGVEMEVIQPYLDCGLKFEPYSMSETIFKVRKKGTLRMNWKRSRGTGNLWLTRRVPQPTGSDPEWRNVFDRDLQRKKGTYAKKLRPGTYRLVTTHTVAVSAEAVGLGGEVEKLNKYRLRVRYTG